MKPFHKPVNLNAKSNLDSALDLIQSINNAIQRLEFQLQTPSESAKSYYLQASEEKQTMVLQNLNYFKASVELSLTKIKSKYITHEEEIECLVTALEAFGMELQDDENFDFIQKNVCIEIYNSQSIQLYRNFEFIKLCPYDLLTLLSREWFELFERDDFTNQVMLKEFNDTVVSGTTESRSSKVPEHSLRCLLSNASEVHFIKFKKLKPVLHRITKRTMGFILTSVATRPKVTEAPKKESLIYLKR